MEMHFELTENPIPPSAPPNGLEKTGAVVEFLGVVRLMEANRPINGLHYEAYPEMARHQFEKIVRELSVPWPCQRVELIHRTGWVPVGEASIRIRVLAAHRREALEMCSALLDRLKQDIPIWKKAPAFCDTAKPD